ncbi:MAG: aminotransferase class IV [Pseudomonadota bacterium]|nr:aminotransferase class IV [Pseudomonadota bacterium]
MTVYLNGRLLAAATARIDPTDRGFTLGDGLFESIAVRGGQVRRLTQHLDRLKNGAEILDLVLPAGANELANALERVRAANGVEDGVLRLTLSRGAALRGLLPAAGTEPTLLITADAGVTDLSPITAITATVTRRNEHSPLAHIKTINYLDNILARREAAEKGADEAILLNTAGRLAETTVANLFMVIGGQTLTPPVAEGALPGVMRADIIAAGEAAERPLVADDILRASEAFATNSAGIRGVVSVDGRDVGGGVPGPIFERLRAMV